MSPDFYSVEESWAAAHRAFVAVQIGGSVLDQELAERYVSRLAALGETSVYVVSHDGDTLPPTGLVTSVAPGDFIRGVLEMSWTNYCVLPVHEDGPSVLVTDRDYRLLVGDRISLASLSDSLLEDRRDFLSLLDLPDTLGFRDTHVQVAQQTAWLASTA